MQLTPNKNLGQHWLHDDSVLRGMCQNAKLTKSDTVLEIGPGLGTLTRYLAEYSDKVLALEFDQRLYEELVENPIASNVEVRQGDILKFDLTKIVAGYKVVANLPYYITSKIVRLLLESANPPKIMTILVQKEVAQRMAAGPGNMSILAVSVQLYCDVSLGALVPASLFTPPPEVDSQVITLVRRDVPLFDDINYDEYFKLVRAGFGEKRKKLRNSLSGGLQIAKTDVEDILTKAKVDLNCRAEQLSLEDWYKILKVYKAKFDL
ncbi:MAG: 16S rRNA (adenine(1518)-N(6)/adenine(1519)-N(6))-dimethyltransferase RsmA [Candidatus Woesebacteria bacterium]|jgi:16S rRNA (adenine1518-N6/adenine1519-N6)-dimethyltransferase